MPHLTDFSLEENAGPTVGPTDAYVEPLPCSNEDRCKASLQRPRFSSSNLRDSNVRTTATGERIGGSSPGVARNLTRSGPITVESISGTHPDHCGFRFLDGDSIVSFQRGTAEDRQS
ncbi:hypothetical protein BHE74_00009932 [Ensete ventricosum]|nr:hypothetical protein GW17_00004364 [Ensete ventricosum]RWW81657.1 hypothetical protein BHE74_00009932 [Ensete ventricosum]RZR84536.1 hypothetical protein BHM03_00011387 [Ensete ventricosum]